METRRSGEPSFGHSLRESAALAEANARLAPGVDGEHPTFCRICEALCGLVATVENGRMVKMAPDRANPHSQGHVCVKGMAAHTVANDPDRLLYPMKRVGGRGEFERVGWDEALADIAARLGAVLDTDGPEAVASYKGNPIAFSAEATIGLKQFLKVLGVDKFYGPASQDISARFVANYLVHGTATQSTFPDLPACDYLIMLGTNPLVSNGSLIFAPRIRHDLDAIAARGEVVVVDPRRTETARRYRHIPIRPNGDAWLLLGMLRVAHDEALFDEAFLASHCAERDALVAALGGYDLAEAARRSGVEASEIAAMVRRFAQTPRAAIYSRVGVCRGAFSTLTNTLVSLLNIVCGKFCRPGGTVFGRVALSGADVGIPGGYGEISTRVGALPSVAGYLPSAVMPMDILESGQGRVRALVMTGGNPVLSAPGAGELERAFESLDLFVAMDLYQNESNRFADYLLPVTSFLERPDAMITGAYMLMRPFMQVTEAVVPPMGEARSEYAIFAALLERMGRALPSPHPLDQLDAAFRAGPVGTERLGEDGWSFDRLRDHPHGIMLDLPDPYSGWESRIAHTDGKLHLWHSLLSSELQRLKAAEDTGELLLFGRRDIRSINSWMHNFDGLTRSQSAALMIHPDDAARLSVKDGDEVLLRSDHGEIIVPVSITADIVVGSVCYPHGWGHRGGWRHANGTAGKNINEIIGVGEGIVERISGTTLMDGIPVTITRIPERELNG